MPNTQPTIPDLNEPQKQPQALPSLQNTYSPSTTSTTSSVVDFDPKQTVQGQMTGLLDSGSDYMQRARATGLSTANARGLLNTSMAAGASQAAAIDKALPIASQDASTFHEQSLAQKRRDFDQSIFTQQSALDKELQTERIASTEGMAERDIAYKQWSIERAHELGMISDEQKFDHEQSLAQKKRDFDQSIFTQQSDLEKSLQTERLLSTEGMAERDIAYKQWSIERAHQLGMISDEQRFDHEQSLAQKKRDFDQSIFAQQSDLDKVLQTERLLSTEGMAEKDIAYKQWSIERAHQLGMISDEQKFDHEQSLAQKKRDFDQSIFAQQSDLDKVLQTERLLSTEGMAARDIAYKQQSMERAHQLGMISDEQKFEFEHTLTGIREDGATLRAQMTMDLGLEQLDQNDRELMHKMLDAATSRYEYDMLNIMTDPVLNENEALRDKLVAMKQLNYRSLIEASASLTGMEVDFSNWSVS